MAAATIKDFIEQTIEQQYADLQSDGVLFKRQEENYIYRNESYTFLGTTFEVEKRFGVVTAIQMDIAAIPTLA